MKRKLLLAAALLAGAWGFNANAQEAQDVTSKYLQNPNFDANPDDVVTVTTQGYQGNVKGNEVAGLQPVQDWTRNHETPKAGASGDGYTGGVFAYGSTNKLNNQIEAPTQGPDGNSDGVALGVLGVWSGTAQYTQSAMLPPGNYTISYSINNRKNDGQDITKSLFGFIANNGTEYLSTQKRFTVADGWKDVVVTFTLDRATAGNISVGYTAMNNGSSAAPHLFVDHVNISYVPVSLEQAKAIWEETHKELEETLPNAVKEQIATELAKNMPETLDEINTATCNLQALIDKFEAVSASYVKVLAFLDKVTLVKDNSIGIKTDIETAISKAKADIETRTSAEALNADYNTLETARQTYVTSGAQPTEGYPFDWTFKLVNPSFETGKTGWEVDRNTTGQWNYDAKTGYNAVDGDYVLDVWSPQINYIDVFQKLTLPAGNYTLSGYLFSADPYQQHIYALVDGTDNSSENMTEKNTWQQLSTDFVVNGGSEVKLGIYSKGKNLDGNTDGWFRADYIQLFYNGGDAQVEVTEADYATYVAPTALAFDEEEAFIVADVDGATATLVSVDAVPAGTPVIIKGEGTHTFSPVATANEPASNLLEVSDGKVTAAEGIYVLAKLEEGVGFYELGEDYTLAAGRVYLNAAGAEVKFIGFNFGGDATAIKGVESTASVENAVIYNLAGQRVQNPSAGIYIVNGKKVLVK